MDPPWDRNLLECAHCYHLVLPPLMTRDGDAGGHYCDKCRKKEADAKSRVTFSPNKVLEIQYQAQRFHCRYREEGCAEHHQWKALASHEEKCEYRPYPCPRGECTWFGRDILAHLLQDHGMSFHERTRRCPLDRPLAWCLDMTDDKQTRTKWWNLLLRLEDGRHFYLCMEQKTRESNYFLRVHALSDTKDNSYLVVDLAQAVQKIQPLRRLIPTSKRTNMEFHFKRVDIEKAMTKQEGVSVVVVLTMFHSVKQIANPM
jgi:hypothetical protein